MTGPLRWRRPAEPDLLLDPLGILPRIVLGCLNYCKTRTADRRGAAAI
jgi:hypothetical protein